MPQHNIPEPDPRAHDDTQPGKPIGIPAPIPRDRPTLPARPDKSKNKRNAYEPLAPVATAPSPRNVEISKRKNEERSSASDRRRNSPLYFPAWSLAVMILLVVGAAFAVGLLVLALGGQYEPSGEPVVVIITALPSSTPPIPQFEPTLPFATLPGISGAVPQFPLEGPTLAPVVLTATPIPIAIGARVRPGGEGVNLRPTPGTQQAAIAIVTFEDEFTVVEGPTESEGLTWWRVQDLRDSSRIGWIAANLLVAVAAPG
jgi:hypothetical protein